MGGYFRKFATKTHGRLNLQNFLVRNKESQSAMVWQLFQVRHLHGTPLDAGRKNVVRVARILLRADSGFDLYLSFSIRTVLACG